MKEGNSTCIIGIWVVACVTYSWNQSNNIPTWYNSNQKFFLRSPLFEFLPVVSTRCYGLSFYFEFKWDVLFEEGMHKIFCNFCPSHVPRHWGLISKNKKIKNFLFISPLHSSQFYEVCTKTNSSWEFPARSYWNALNILENGPVVLISSLLKKTPTLHLIWKRSTYHLIW